MKKTKPFVRSLAAFTFIALLSGCAQAEPPASTTSHSEYVSYLEDSEQFDAAISQGLVLVDFYADWCGPCRRLSPLLTSVADKMDGKLQVLKVNVDKHAPLARKFKVSSIPFMVLFKNGSKQGSQLGLLSEEKLESWVNSAL